VFELINEEPEIHMADYQNPSYVWRCNKVVSLAKAMLQNEVGIIEGARQMDQLRHSVGGDPDFGNDPDFEIFDVIACETEDLPLSKVRELWSADALLEKDKEIAKAEQLYKKSALDACRKLIERFKDSKWIRE